VHVSGEPPVSQDGPTREVKISFSRLDKMTAKEAADLVGLLDESDSLTEPVLLWEIWRRLSEVKTTLLAFRFLLPLSADDREDAWRGLMGCSFKAVGTLYAPAGSKEERRWATAQVIEDVLKKFFAPYSSVEPNVVLAAALAGKFRHIGTHVQHRLIDYIRHYKAIERKWKRREERRTWQTTFAQRDGKQELAYHPSLPQLFEIFLLKEKRYKPLLGAKNWETLLLLKEAAGQSAKHKREFKGGGDAGYRIAPGGISTSSSHG
jgi:hypothetical protein